MSQKIIHIIFIFLYINLNVFGGNTVGNQLHENNNKIFETRHLAGFEQDSLNKTLKKYSVFHIKSNDIISYLQNKNFQNDLFIDFLHLGKWQLSLYNNNLLEEKSYQSFQGLTCQSLGEIHFNIGSNFIEAYIDNGENRYFIEPLQHYASQTEYENLYVVYEPKDVLSKHKKDAIEHFLKTARALEQDENFDDTCDIALAYEKNIVCLSDKNIFPVLKNADKGGYFSVFPSGLHLNTETGEIVVGKSKADIYIISYKKGNCISDFVVDILDLPSAAFELPKTHFRPKDRPVMLKGNITTGYFKGLGVKDGFFYPNLIPSNLRNQAIEITHTVFNGYCEHTETQTVFVGGEPKVKQKKYVLETSIILEDAYIAEKKEMRTDLLKQKVLPLSQPYNMKPWNYQGNEKLLTYAHFPKNTVDWVLLELRDSQKINSVLAQKAALLLSDGSIINFEKHKNGLIFDNIDEYKGFHVVVRHRNHIDIISKNIIAIMRKKYHSQPNLLALIYAKDYQKQSELFSGDADGNNVVSVRDFEYFQKEYGKKNTYSFFDFNLDGQVNETDLECYIKNATEIGMKEVRY